MSKTTNHLHDLVVVSKGLQLTVVETDGERTTAVATLKVRRRDEPIVLRQRLDRVLYQRRVRRVLLSVHPKTSYEALVAPTVEALDVYRVARGIPFLWIPDVLAVAQAAHEDFPARRRLARLPRLTRTPRL